MEIKTNNQLQLSKDIAEQVFIKNKIDNNINSDDIREDIKNIITFNSEYDSKMKEAKNKAETKVIYSFLGGGYISFLILVALQKGFNINTTENFFAWLGSGFLGLLISLMLGLKFLETSPNVQYKSYNNIKKEKKEFYENFQHKLQDRSYQILLLSHLTYLEKNSIEEHNKKLIFELKNNIIFNFHEQNYLEAEQVLLNNINLIKTVDNQIIQANYKEESIESYLTQLENESNVILRTSYVINEKDTNYKSKV